MLGKVAVTADRSAPPQISLHGGHSSAIFTNITKHKVKARHLQPGYSNLALAIEGNVKENGDPYGNRTRVSAVKGPRPNR